MSHQPYYLTMTAVVAGAHLVHTRDCPAHPEPAEMFDIGEFETPKHAVEASLDYVRHVEGCRHCCPARRWTRTPDRVAGLGEGHEHHPA